MGKYIYDGISVVVPVFNREKTLARCLESIINQDYTNLEIICVDDGSTDSSLKILNGYAEQDHRIRVIHQENQGVSSARNCGIAYATMPLITFVDSDDTIEPQMYSKMIEKMAENELECICCNYKRISPDGRLFYSTSGFGNGILRGEEIREKIVKSEMGFSGESHTCLPTVCNKIFILEIINKNNIRFNERRSHGEDWLFCIQYYAFIDSVGFLTDAFYNYIMTFGSLIGKARKNAFEISVETTDLFQKLFPEFPWERGEKYEEIKNRPFESALYYYKVFRGEERQACLRDIYRICKEKNYYKELTGLSGAQQELKTAIERDDEKAFIDSLQKHIKKEFIVFKIQAAVKSIMKAALKAVRR